MTAVVVYDDDVDYACLLAERLRREGFTTETADATSAVALAVSGRFDIVVLGAADGVSRTTELLKRIRRHRHLPVLVLIDSADETERIVALELGADDCIAKPCSHREVVARVRAILRRVGSISKTSDAIDEHAVNAGALIMWPKRREAEWSGHRLALTSTEFDLLEVLARHAGEIISKQQLSEQCLGRSLQRFDRSIDVHMSSIRQKLGRLPDGRSGIQTVFRRGYQFIK